MKLPRKNGKYRRLYKGQERDRYYNFHATSKVGYKKTLILKNTRYAEKGRQKNIENAIQNCKFFLFIIP